ncbi:MAG: hypothetical protein ABIE74_07310 [Pseudomonadota bacterium]
MKIGPKRPINLENLFHGHPIQSAKPSSGDGITSYRELAGGRLGISSSPSGELKALKKVEGADSLDDTLDLVRSADNHDLRLLTSLVSSMWGDILCHITCVSTLIMGGSQLGEDKILQYCQESLDARLTEFFQVISGYLDEIYKVPKNDIVARPSNNLLLEFVEEVRDKGKSNFISSPTTSYHFDFQTIDDICIKCFGFIKKVAETLIEFQGCDPFTVRSLAGVYAEVVGGYIDWLRFYTQKIIIKYDEEIRKELESLRHDYTNWFQGLVGGIDIVAISSASLDENIDFLKDQLNASRDISLDRPLAKIVQAHTVAFRLNPVDFPEYGANTSMSVKYLLGRVVTNVLTNSATYAYPNFTGGPFEISMLYGLICFSDCGQGMDEEVKSVLGKELVTSGSVSTGSGMHDLSTRALPELGAKMAFFSRRNVGTSFILSLPTGILKPVDETYVKFPTILSFILSSVAGFEWANLEAFQKFNVWKRFSSLFKSFTAKEYHLISGEEIFLKAIHSTPWIASSF